jgi:hypothetical protein
VLLLALLLAKLLARCWEAARAAALNTHTTNLEDDVLQNLKEEIRKIEEDMIVKIFTL